MCQLPCYMFDEVKCMSMILAVKRCSKCMAFGNEDEHHGE